MGASGGGGGQTTTQVQALPEWQKDYAQANEQIAGSLASRPFPTYPGQIIAGFDPKQTQGMDMAAHAATAHQPYLQNANAMTIGSAEQWSPQAAGQYMSPYAMAALAPQMQALQMQQDQQRKQIGSQATQAGAFGDARQGIAEGMNDFYGNLAQNDLVAQGMNSAYNAGNAAFNADKSRLGQAGQAEAQLGSNAQGLGISGAASLFNAGSQQQELNQQQLSTSYNNFMNQFNYPLQGLNMRISALANSPYTQANYTTLAPPSGFGQAAGAATALAGALGMGQTTGQNVWGSATSDIRLKKNIKYVGRTKKHKLPVYEFNYLWNKDTDTPHVGVMAQHAISVIPDAVMIDAYGFGAVNYDMIG